VARRYQKVLENMKGKGNVGRCFAVIMIGRLDDYLRDVFLDTKAGIAEEHVQKAGLAVVKKLVNLYKQNGYAAKLMVAALRGNYHMSELAGADIVMSIHPKYQKNILEEGLGQEERIGREIDKTVLDALLRHEEFARAYDENGVPEAELITYGPTQRTLTQFSEVGWKALEGFSLTL
jgi:transaldolase